MSDQCSLYLIKKVIEEAEKDISEKNDFTEIYTALKSFMFIVTRMHTIEINEQRNSLPYILPERFANADDKNRILKKFDDNGNVKDLCDALKTHLLN